jgi:predicted acyl esterase
MTFALQGIPHRAAVISLLCSVSLGFLSPPVFAEDSPSTPEYGISIEEVWITMPDGVRLAADLHRPHGAPADMKFPVLLEYLPYRKTEARSGSYSMFPILCSAAT